MENLFASIKRPFRNNPIYKLGSTKYESIVNLRRYMSEARRLKKGASNVNNVEELIALQQTSKIFLSGQIKSEIKQLVSFLAERNPTKMMEIGTRKGGTLFLFSQVCHAKARIISIDYQYPSIELRKALRYYAKPGQSIVTIEGDSHKEETLLKVKSVLDKHLLDFLFIDGDHSYEGVRRDYELYADLVKVGGIIAFHDIVPDYSTKYGRKTISYAGQVPHYWQELKSQSLETLELIDQDDQDGYGIGLIFKK